MSAWQRCNDMGLSHGEFVELTSRIAVRVLERLPEDKLWLIPLCIIKKDRLCKMRFMYPSLEEFVELIHNNTMSEIRDVFTQSAAVVDLWMGLLMEESGLDSLDAILDRDWNMEKPVIALSGQTLRKRTENYLLAVATSCSIKIMYPFIMVGPVSILKMDEYRAWYEFKHSQGSGVVTID